MSTSGLHQYYLYHTRSKTIIGNLNWVQTKSICKSMDSDRVRYWLIYSSKYKTWRPLLEVLFDFIDKGHEKFNYQVPEIPLNLKTTEVTSMEAIPEERRESPRFQRNLSLILDVDGQLIHAETKDISLSGLKLNQAIELESKPKYVMCIVKTEKNILELKLAPLYIPGVKSVQALKCISVSDMFAWKALQIDQN